MSRLFVVALVLLSAAIGATAKTPGSRSLLALTGGALGSGGRLVALDPVTLAPRGRRLDLPGWAFGYEWARSPHGSAVALVPKPSETNERLFIIGSEPVLRVLARLPLPGLDVCRLAWPRPDWLLLVVTQGPACYNRIDGARLLVVDPRHGRLLAQRPLSGPANVVATARTAAGVAVLLVPAARAQSARLLVAGVTGTRTILLPPGFRSPLAPLDKAVGSRIGLTLDPAGKRAYLVEPDGRVTAVDLATGRATVHALALHSTAAAAKGIVAPIVQALWLGHGRLAFTRVRRGPAGRLLPLGLHILDTRSWAVRLVDPAASAVAYAETTLLAYERFSDRLGTARIGLRAYRVDGTPRFRALAGEVVDLVRTQGRYAYCLSRPSGTSVIDLRTGRVQVAAADASLVYELLAGPGP